VSASMIPYIYAVIVINHILGTSVTLLHTIFISYLFTTSFFIQRNAIWSMAGLIIVHNGPRIGDSGGLESQNLQFYTNLSNSHLLFSKFMKKGNIKGCCDKKRRNFQFLP